MNQGEIPEDQQKQQFCYDEIIEKGYKAEEFEIFMKSQRQNGDQIDNWTFSELKSKIMEFQNAHKQQEDTVHINKLNVVDIIESPESPEYLKQRSSIIFRQSEVNYEIELKPNLIVKPTNKILEVKQSNLWIKDQVKIEVSNPHEQSEGFFGLFGSHLCFDLTTKPVVWKVKRKIIDFYNLRNALSKEFPERYIPALLDEDYVNQQKTSEKAFQEKLKLYFQRFFDELCEQKEFFSSKILLTFLNETNQSRWQSRIKDAMSLPKNMDVRYKTSLDKIINLSIDKETLAKSQKYEEFIIRKIKLHSEAIKYLNEFNYHQKLAAEQLINVDNILKQISDISDDDPMLNFKYSYQLLGENLNYWSRQIQKQIKNVEKTLINSFENIQFDKPALIQLKDNVQETLFNFHKESLKLQEKKEKLFQIKDYNKWEMKEVPQIDLVTLYNDKNIAFKYMCQKQTDELENYKESYFYFVQIFIEEAQNKLKKIEWELMQSINQFATTQQEIQVEITTGLVNVQSVLSSI